MQRREHACVHTNTCIKMFTHTVGYGRQGELNSEFKSAVSSPAPSSQTFQVLGAPVSPIAKQL